MKVKICGIKTAEAACHAVECGADAIGFVFAESKRKLTVSEAKKIIELLPEHVWKVGVFVNESTATVKRTADIAGLTHIQLHGDETTDEFKGIGLPLIKSVSIKAAEDLPGIQAFETEYILLDSPPGKYRGGNGTSFNWDQAKSFGVVKTNVILAGGLNPGNVALAISKVKPFMVDVSSGVETNGKKDFTKIKNFISNAKYSGEAENNDCKHL